MASQATIRHVRPTAGFTLVEVLISMAIALVLIIGISQIFSMAQQTSGAGTTLLKDNESQRTIQQTLNQDFQEMDTADDTPGIVIASYSMGAFRNKQDMLSTGGTDPRVFNPPAGPGASQAFEVNDHIHRLDRMCFFARGQFQRQTAEAPNYVSPTSSTEAFIWLGHLALPNNAAISSWDPNDPGGMNASSPSAAWLNPAWPSNSTVQQNNDNNFFASDWILGRQVILLNPTGTEPGFMFNPGHCFLSTGVQNSPPAQGAAQTTVNQVAHGPIFASRCDLAYTTMALCQSQYASPRYQQEWWEDISGLMIAPVPSYPWKAGALLDSSAYIVRDVRYFANPFPTKPASYQGAGGTNATPAAFWMSAAAAQTAPIFVRGCSQFIVEFAGNFLTQEQDPTKANFGQITAAVPDQSGKLDFIPVRDANGNWTRQIRWYGFPRDVNGDGVVDINVPPGGTPPPYSPTRSSEFDVVPLVTVIRAALGQDKWQAAFEKDYPANIMADGFAQMPLSDPSVAPNIARSSGAYICAWDPKISPTVEPRPKMIRIVIGIDDPSGRLNSEQTFEYIFTLP